MDLLCVCDRGLKSLLLLLILNSCYLKVGSICWTGLHLNGLNGGGNAVYQII